MPRAGDGDRVADAVARLRRADGDAGLLADDLQLLHRVRSLQVGGDQQRGVALALEPQRSLPASVVLPAPCRPASMITVGGFLANTSRRVSPPRIAISSSLTILMTCCAGFSAAETSAPVARCLIFAMNSRTTGSATSASSSAIRISRQVASMSAGVSRPLPRRFEKTVESRSERVSNTLMPHRSAGKPEQVAPFEQGGDGLGLDRGRGRVAFVVERTKDGPARPRSLKWVKGRSFQSMRPSVRAGSHGSWLVSLRGTSPAYLGCLGDNPCAQQMGRHGPKGRCA